MLSRNCVRNKILDLSDFDFYQFCVGMTYAINLSCKL